MNYFSEWLFGKSGKQSESSESNPDAQKSLDPETLAEIRQLHFGTRRLADESLMGGYRSAFKGRGIEFEDVREYSAGDDVRSIDWKVTARSGRPFIKRFREERELSVMLAVDVSGSALTGSEQSREKLIARVGAVLTMIALRNGDKVGLVTYSDQVEKYFPPRKSRNSVWRIIREVMTAGDYNSGTDLAGLNRFLLGILKRKSVVIVISDFFDIGILENLAQLAKRHDVTAVVVEDPLDISLPNLGIVEVKDPETGECTLLDTSYKSSVEKFRCIQEKQRSDLKSSFSKWGVSSIWLRTDRAFLPAIKSFLADRYRGVKNPVASCSE